MNFGLKDSVISQIQEVLSHYPEVEKAVIYGSRAKGNFRNGSDIDLTLFGKNLTLSVVAEIENELDDLLLPYMFDISIFSHISNDNLVQHINRVGIVFYENCKQTYS